MQSISGSHILNLLMTHLAELCTIGKLRVYYQQTNMYVMQCVSYNAVVLLDRSVLSKINLNRSDFHFVLLINF